MNSVKIHNLSYKYPGKSEFVIKKINLKVGEGEFLFITGPSSAGKTTLCRCISGIIPHFFKEGKITGRVDIFGKDVSKMSYQDIVKYVGVVSQNAENQLFSLSVEKDVAFGLENIGLPRQEIKKRVNWALKVTGMLHLRKRPPYALSGGQQQRAVIASVLAMRPQIMILDEPTSFLDPSTSEKILETIKKLNRELGVTIILVEQRLDMVSFLSDKIVIMKNGKITHLGNPKRIYMEKHVYSKPKVVELYNKINKTKKTRQLPLTPDEMSKIIRGIIK